MIHGTNENLHISYPSSAAMVFGMYLSVHSSTPDRVWNPVRGKKDDNIKFRK